MREKVRDKKRRERKKDRERREKNQEKSTDKSCNAINLNNHVRKYYMTVNISTNFTNR